MKSDKKKSRKHSSLAAASIGRSATAQVDPHRDRGYANTGTNVSYEGATAPAAGGSVGTGYASGKPADDEKITTNSDFVQNRGGSPTKDDEDTNGESEDDLPESDDFYLDEEF